MHTRVLENDQSYHLLYITFILTYKSLHYRYSY